MVLPSVQLYGNNIVIQHSMYTNAVSNAIIIYYDTRSCNTAWYTTGDTMKRAIVLSCDAIVCLVFIVVHHVSCALYWLIVCMLL